jgi:hypothetical protein
MPQAHTDGDMYAFFARENVLVAGGGGEVHKNTAALLTKLASHS